MIGGLKNAVSSTAIWPVTYTAFADGRRFDDKACRYCRTSDPAASNEKGGDRLCKDALKHHMERL